MGVISSAPFQNIANYPAGPITIQTNRLQKPKTNVGVVMSPVPSLFDPARLQQVKPTNAAQGSKLNLMA